MGRSRPPTEPAATHRLRPEAPRSGLEGRAASHERPRQLKHLSGALLSQDHLSERTLAHVRALNEIAGSRGQTLAQMAVSWVLRDDRMTSALIGASSVTQLEENLAAAAKTAFTADEIKAIDEDAVEAGINIWATSSQG